MASAINDKEIIQERYQHYYGIDTDVTPPVPYSAVVGWTGAGYARTDGGASLTLQLAYDGSGNIEYLGEALPGSLTSESKWRIAKLAYSSGNMTSMKYADSSTDFDKVWDNKATYTYA